MFPSFQDSSGYRISSKLPEEELEVEEDFYSIILFSPSAFVSPSSITIRAELLFAV